MNGGGEDHPGVVIIADNAPMPSSGGDEGGEDDAEEAVDLDFPDVNTEIVFGLGERYDKNKDIRQVLGDWALGGGEGWRREFDPTLRGLLRDEAVEEKVLILGGVDLDPGWG